MAGIIGGEAGYASVGPTRNYIGEAMSNVQDNMFRQNAQRIADDRTKIEAERTAIEDRRRDFEDAQQFAKQNPFIATGTGLDASNRQSYMNAKGIAAEARANFMATGDQKYNAIYENAIASVNHLSEMPNKLNTLKEDWVKNVADYNPQSLQLKAELIDKLGNGDIVQTNDANGNPRYSIFDRDENGDLAKVSHKEISGQQLLALMTPVKSFNVTGEKGFVDQFQKSIGKQVTKKEVVGNVEKEITYTPGSEEVAKTMAQAATKNKGAVYSALQELGLDPENDSNYSDPIVLGKVSDFYENLLNKNAPKVESEKPNLEVARFNADEKQRKISNANEATRIKIAKESAKNEKKPVRLTVKNGIFGEETSATRSLSDAEYEAYLEQNKAKVPETTPDVWKNPITDGIKKAFSGKDKTTKAKETPKERALRLARK